MSGYEFTNGLAVLEIPPMPPVCLVIGHMCGNSRLPALAGLLPVVVVYGPQDGPLVLRPGDRISGLTGGVEDLEALCRASSERHGGWNAHALADAVRSLAVHGVEWGSDRLSLPLAA